LGPRGKNVHSTKRDSCQVSGWYFGFLLWGSWSFQGKIGNRNIDFRTVPTMVSISGPHQNKTVNMEVEAREKLKRHKGWNSPNSPILEQSTWLHRNRMRHRS
jgi:hypothetical protein